MPDFMHWTVSTGSPCFFLSANNTVIRCMSTLQRLSYNGKSVMISLICQHKGRRSNQPAYPQSDYDDATSTRFSDEVCCRLQTESRPSRNRVSTEGSALMVSTKS